MAVVNDPTDRQLEVLRLVGAGKTWREIGDELGITSTNSVSDHIKALERKGALVQDVGETGYGKSRGLRVTARGLSWLGLACCPTCGGSGTVRA